MGRTGLLYVSVFLLSACNRDPVPLTAMQRDATVPLDVDMAVVDASLPIDATSPIDAPARDLAFAGPTCRVDGDCGTGLCLAGRCARNLSFRSAPSYGTGRIAQYLATADFTSDGKLDVVVSGEGVGALVVLVNQGGGVFDQRSSGPQLGGPVVAADLDDDGKADVAGIENSVDPAFVAARGDGKGGFAAPVTVKLTNRASDLVVADFDGDGDLDAMVGVLSFNPTTLTFLRNDGGNSWAVDGTYPLEANPRDLHAADLDGDHELDVAATLGDNWVAVLQGNGDGTFVAPRYVPTGAGLIQGRVAVADLDGDGALDFAVPTDKGVVRLLGDGQGGFGQPALAATPVGRLSSLVAGDLDSDGRTDLVVSNNTFGLTVLRNTGQGRGTFDDGTGYVAGLAPNYTAIADVDGDALPDVLALDYMSPGLSVLKGIGGGELHAGRMRGPFASAAPMGVGDFDRDGRVDFVLPTDDPRLAVVRNAGNAPWPISLWTLPFQPHMATVLDVDGDHLLDAAAAYSNSAGVMRGNGDGTFQLFGGQQLGPRTALLVAGDLNEDGLGDLLTSDAILLRDRQFGFVSTRDTFPPGTTLADLDGDGHLDAVGSDPKLGAAIGIRLGDGKGHFAASTRLASAANTNPGVVQVRDLDEDGRPEIISVELANVVVYPAGGSGKPTIYPLPESCPDLAIADFNGDRRPDIACGPGQSTFVVLLNLGSSFDAPRLFTGAGPRAVSSQSGQFVATDWSGDGLPDLALSTKAGLVTVLNTSR